MMSKNIFCEACGKTGMSSKMSPLQLNMQEALLVCENSECVFPLGTERVQFFIISRKVEELSLKNKRKKSIAFEKIHLNYQNKDQVIHWENVDALCWLDSVLGLIVNNTAIKLLLSKVQSNENSLLKYLIEQYKKAQYLAEFDQINAQKILEDVRGLVWTFLSPKMKCALGVNDSPLFALPLLLRETDITAEKCLQEYQSEFRCQECGHAQITRHKKHIVTLPNTPKDFDLQQVSFLKTCSNCGAQDQSCRIAHQRVPEVLFFHFVEGLKSSHYLNYKLLHNGDSYHLTQFIQYRSDPDHFICWTRNDEGSKWLELDDLKPCIHHWSTIAPGIPPSQVHIIVLQKIPSLKQDLCKANTILFNGPCSLKQQLTSSELPNENVDGFTNSHDVKMSYDGNLECLPEQEKLLTLELNDTNANHIEDLACSYDIKTSHNDHHNNLWKPETLSSPTLQDTSSILGNHICLNDTNTTNICSVGVEAVPPVHETNSVVARNVTVQDVVHELEQKLSINNSQDKSTKCCIDCNSNRIPLRNLNTQNTTNKSSSTTTMKCVDRRTFSNIPSSTGSLFRVAVKRFSSSKEFHPLFAKKQRTFLPPQFQPYIPKKERTCPTLPLNTDKVCPTILDKIGDDLQSPTSPCSLLDGNTDSGYSSPSSVSSSLSSMSTFSKEESIADQLEKLLPDCLEDCAPPSIRDISMHQDDFIRQLLFDE